MATPLLTMFPAILLLLPFVPGVFMNDFGVVKSLKAVIDNDQGDPVHTWYQKNPSNHNSDELYKLECFLHKSSEKQFIAKLYFENDLLETFLVNRFDEDFLDSVAVFKSDKEGKHVVRYMLTEENGVACEVHTYEKNEAGKYTTSEQECKGGIVGKLFANKGKGKGWKWDQEAVKHRRHTGSVVQVGLKDKTFSGKPLHSWSHRLYGFGYRMALNRVDGKYYATLSYEKAVLDTLEVVSLGDNLLHSITVLGMDHNNEHVVQYKMTDNSCVRLNYPKTIAGGAKTPEGQTMQPSKCKHFMRRLAILYDILTFSHHPDNGWNW